MKKGLAVTIISILAVLAIVLGILYITNNNNKTDEVNKITAEKQRQAEQIAGLEADIADRKTQIESLTADAAEMAGKIETLSTDTADKASQIETMSADVADKAGMIEALNADVADKISQIEELNADVVDKAGQIEALNADAAEKAGQIEALNAEVSDKISMIEALNTSVTDKVSQIEALNADVTDKASQIEALNTDVTDKASQIEALNADVTDKASQIEALNADVTDKASQIEALNADVTDKASQIEALNADVELKGKQIGELETVVADNAKKIETLEADVAEKSKQIEALEAEVAAKAQPEPKPQAASELDYAKVFPSWNPDSASLKELVDFVSASVDESSPDYIEPADRIATFDMDGTIISEKAPIYVDSCLTMYRVLDDPTYTATDAERAAMQEMRDHAYATGENYKPDTFTKDDLVASAFAGMTPEEFRAYVVDFADKQEVIGFKGMTYGQSFYKPMIEVIDYLRANGYDVWMVSACEREVVRGLVQRWNIPYDHCIATDVQYVASGADGVVADEYDMTQAEKIVLGSPLNEIEVAKSGKPAAIAREIGRRPVLAFGNSSGDFSMLNYAEGNPNHKGMGIFVVCDDTVREYGDAEKAQAFYDKVKTEGWTAFSMANDWKDIYGEGVEKTELPGAQQQEELPDAA
ncbi:MAG: haloacid dehalogenase-like hydrolase [Clostridia bacterium]|nr:haloacid dehalogenase-like hydrolase [Clostridia bacterium]